MNEVRLKKETVAYSNFHVMIPVGLHARVDEARAQLLREGVRVSYASLVEIALGELLSHHDLATLLRKRGASARRR